MKKPAQKSLSNFNFDSWISEKNHYEKIMVTFANGNEDIFNMSMFDMLISDKCVKMITSAETGELYFDRSSRFNVFE